MVGKDGPIDGSSSSGGAGSATEMSAIKKVSVLDWVALRPRTATMEEKQHWVCMLGGQERIERLFSRFLSLLAVQEIR